jgi:Kef-type K+ transport system membrane component KefB
MAIIFTVPYLFWRLLKTDSWAPLVVVQIVMGVLLGPGVLGVLAPTVYSSIFTPPVIAALNGVAWWAVSLFVFVAGIELNLQHAWKDRRATGITAGLALAVPLIMGSLAAVILLQWPGWIGARAETWQFVVGIGMAAAVTALPILIVLMEKLKILRTDLGQRVLRYASLDDILIWAVLAVILMDWHRIGNQTVFLVSYVIAALALRRLMIRLPQQDRWYVSLIWLVFCALLADWAGLHYMVGAFLAGVVIDSDWFDQQELDWVRNTILLMLMPVFFLSTGLRTSWEIGGYMVFAAALLILVMQILGKQIAVQIAGRIQGWAPGDATLIGWLLQTKALIEIIFATVLLDKQIITGAMFTALLLMALASTMLTTPIVRPLLLKRAAADK